MSQAKELTPDTKIRLLLALINDDGFEKFDKAFNKLITRFNEFYDLYSNDIIHYLTQAILYIPLKTKIYAFAIYKFNKNDITKQVFEQINNHLLKNNDCFCLLRIFIFYIQCTILKIIPEKDFLNFIEKCINNKNNSSLWYIIKSIVMLYNKNENCEIIEKTLKLINDSYLLKDSLLWKIIYDYFNDTNKSIKGCFLDIKEEENIEFDSSNLINPFENLEDIKYENLDFPKDIDYEIIYNKDITYENYHYKLILSDIVNGLKDNFLICEKYLFNLNQFYNLESNEENNIQINILDNLPSVILSLILYSLISQSDLILYSSLTVDILKNKSSLFIETDDKEKEINKFTKYISEILQNENFLKSLSSIQIKNLVEFISFYLPNISNSKSDILNLRLVNQSNIYNNYYGKCLCNKICTLITKKQFMKSTSIYNETFLQVISEEPKIDDSLKKNEDFIIMSDNIKNKNHYNDFESSLMNKSNENELLYNFISAIIYNRSKTFSHLNKSILLYSEVIKEMSKNNKDEKEKIIIKSIFDSYEHSTTHLIFLIGQFLDNFLISHSNVIKFIFTEKLLQSKEHIINWIYYELIEFTLKNSNYLNDKTNKLLKDEQTNLAESNEDARKDIIQKIENLENLINDLDKEKESLPEKICQNFIALYDTSEKLGGEELKFFVKKTIENEIKKFLINNLIDEEQENKYSLK
jgi:hypothetical protein